MFQRGGGAQRRPSEGNTTMEAALGTPVITADGRNLGTIEWLIVDRESRRVRAVAIRRGFIATHGIRIGIGDLEEGPEGTVRARYTAEEIHRVPRAELAQEMAYSAAAVGEPPLPEAEPVWPSDTYLALWRHEHHDVRPSDLKEILGQQDVDNVIIDGNTVVLSREGDKVGEIEQATFDIESGDLKTFVLRSGIILHTRRLLPADTIVGMDDGYAYLGLTAEEVESIKATPQ